MDGLEGVKLAAMDPDQNETERTGKPSGFVRFCIDAANTSEYAFFGPQGGAMARLRAVFCVGLSLIFVMSTAMGASAPAMGTVTSALGAQVGTAAASVGTTVFGGDKLSTGQTGSMQVRTGAARFMLSSSSAATMLDAQGTPSAVLEQGTAVFSTANAKAFMLRASEAEFRPETDAPTVAQVTYVNAKEMIVKSTRGSLTVTVDGESQVVPEGMSYRVVLDPDSYMETAMPAAQGPQGAGASGKRGVPRKAGRSRFLLIAIIVTGVATALVLDEVLESPHKP